MEMLIWWKLNVVAIALHIIASFAFAASSSSSSNSSWEAARLLLAFKQSCIESDPNGLLSDWKAASSSPCSWRGISCSPEGEVVSIDLSHGGLSGSLEGLTQLTALPSLRHISLQGNSFSSGLELNSSTCSFETLDLSSNKLSSFINISCPHLSSLNLSSNLIHSVSASAFSFSTSLQQLDISRNRISDWGLLSRSLSSTCRHLNLLNLSDNMLSGHLDLSFLISCSATTTISTLDLSYNLFSGTIPPNFLIDSLNHLDLSYNNFSTQFSSLHFGQCTNLTTLFLSRASLYGSSFPITLTNCRLLQTLDLSHNYIGSHIPTSLGSLPILTRLSLSHNHFSGQIPPHLGIQLCSTLQHLDLSSNQLSGGLPITFASCSSLHTLNLATNHLSGDFLTTVVTNLQNLRYLYLAFNNITGHVPVSLANCTALQLLDLSSNTFTGNIPTGLCSVPSSLEKILLADNFLSGTVPVELGSCKKLTSIDLSFNALSGPIPMEIWRLPSLSDLIMWANNLTGTIPQGICVDGGNLQMLILNNNFLHGDIPESIEKCTNMIWISLSSNRLTGQIPRGIGSLPKLAILQMGNNSLSGTVPPEIGLCRSLIWLDLNSNNLTGTIPSQLADQAGLVVAGIVSGKQFAFVRNEGGTACRGAGGLIEFEGVRAERLEMFPMVHSCPSTRIYSGMTVYTFSNNGSMIYLDLSYNSLSGAIPEKLGAMNYLQVLNLGHNSLTGNIPYSLGGLRTIGVLDLSHNKLDGFLPGSLATLSFLSDLDVSNNNLTGPIPSGGQLTTFPASRYENNSAEFCGLPLPPCGCHSCLAAYNGHRRKQPVAAGLIIGTAFFVLCILFLTLALHRVKKQQRQKGIDQLRGNKYLESLPNSGGETSSWKLSSVPEPLSINVATFEKPLRKLTFAHLVEATNGFSMDSLIGSGGFGEVYKAQLRDGCVVAIKKLIQVTGQGDREFMAEMETIGKIKHRNLVPLLGYCKVGEERLLVYEYMKWGSLEAVLHDNKSKGMVLGWAARKKIAIGSARGLAFLHHSCIPHIIHRDMKSSNVLLDQHFEARVSDFGMARLVNALDTHLSVSTLAGTPGYVPPEYYQSFRCTAKGDVYSYGVVLLELLSGKRPIDPAQFGDDNNLVGWAKQLQREKRSREILDPELVRVLGCGETEKEKSNYVAEAELCHYLRIAFECLDDRPLRRPTMIQVMAKFKEVDREVDNSLGSSISNSSSSNSDILDAFSLKDTHLVQDQDMSS